MSVPVLPSNLYFMPTRLIDAEAELDDPKRAYATGLGCMRGLRFALAIEAGTAVLLFGVWSAWHMLAHIH